MSAGDEHEARQGEERRLEERVGRQAGRLRRAERERRTLVGETVYLGTLGLLFVLPVVGGAYLGRWLDELLAGYQVRWTVSMILLGVALGVANVYLFVRERE